MEARHMSLSPHLPAELLAYAFVLGLPHISFDSPRDVIKYQVLLGSVCSSWRGIAHRTPALWVPLVIQRPRPTTSTDSQTMGESMLEASATRSGVLELELYIECIDGHGRDRGLSPKTTSLLVSIIPRARVLSLKTDGRYTFNILFPLQSAPHLRRLEIRGLDQRGAPPPIVLFSFNADAPLELFDFWGPWGTSLAQINQTPVAHLKCFMVSSYAHEAQYGDFLSRCTNLEILKLRYCDESMARVPLPPSLKVLELQYNNIGLPSPPFMPAPSLVHLTIRRCGFIDRWAAHSNRHERLPEWPPLPLLETLSVHAPRYFNDTVLAVIRGAPKLTAIEINASLVDSGYSVSLTAQNYKTILACPRLGLLRIVSGVVEDSPPSPELTHELYGDMLTSHIPNQLKVELYIKPIEPSIPAMQYYSMKQWLGWRDCGTLDPNDFPTPPLREVISGRPCP